MTGYDAANPGAPDPQDSRPADPGPARPGPHPPRIEPTGFAAPPAPSFQATPSFQTTSSFPPTAGFPAAPGSGAFPPTGPLPGSAAQPPGPMAPPRPAPRRNVLGGVSLILVLLLFAVVAVQAVMIVELRSDADTLRRDAAAERATAAERADALDKRASDLERRTLDTAAVAGSVLPAVFRISTLTGKGTAFGFGNETSDGGTYLITNYHVVDKNWESGQKQVDLEQQNRRFTGQIVKVDERSDLALITSTEKFSRLSAAAEPAKPGQPVVVVGDPRGLENSVTSGVVSAQREGANGPIIQFDAPVNPGNSGGPIVNAQGQLVGVVNAKLEDAEGISLGIPVAVVCESFGIC